jgi:lysophospholipase L1-like esterase
MRNTKNLIFSAVLLVVSTLAALAIGEVVLRIKNASMQNYDIEMWRYAKELKRRSDNPLLGHEHEPSRTALLQSVEIRTNELGLRRGPLASANPGKRRILFLGSSVTLGWGVPEPETVTARLEKMFASDGQEVEVLNAGIGNYNAPRYVERFLTRLTSVKPTDIVVHYFLRDAEVLEAGGGNALLRNSELAVTAWVAISRYFGKAGEKSLEEHYRHVYRTSAEGYQEMRAALKKLADYAKANNIRVYLAMTPDVHDMVDYRFAFIHEQLHKVADELGFVFIDLLPSMRNLTPKELWSMPGDPHPNGLGHRRMAEAIYPKLKLPQ